MLYIIKANLILALLCLLFQVLMHRDTFFGVRRLMLWGIYATAFLLPLCNLQALLTADTAASDMAEAYASYVLPTLNVTAMRVASFGVEQNEPGCGMWFVGMMAIWMIIYLIPVVWMTTKLLMQVAYLIYLRCTCSPLGMTNDESRFARNDESGRMTNDESRFARNDESGRMTNDESRFARNDESGRMTNDKSRFARNDESKSLSNPESNSHSSFVTRHSSLFRFPRPCSPFSFGPWIFIHPDGMNEQTLREVLIHEQAHVRGWHTLDILFSQLVCILFWWNPAAWVMRREVRLNLEFIADKAVADYIEVKSERVKSEKNNSLNEQASNSDSYSSLGGEADIFHFSLKIYQYRLLGFSLQKNVATIVNNFNVLPLKRRIKMMNLQRTPRTGMLKYILYVPVAAVMLLLSNIDSLARTIADNVKKPIELVDDNASSQYRTFSLDLTKGPSSSANLKKWEGKSLTALIVDGKPVTKVTPLTGQWLESIDISNVTITEDSEGNITQMELRTKKVAANADEPAVKTVVQTLYEADDIIYETCEQLPEYLGGLDAMYKSLIENVRYPKVAHDCGVQGKVMVSFVVEKDGTLTEVKADKARDVKTGQELSEMVVVAYNRDQTPEEAKKAEDARHYNEGIAALKAEAVRAVKAMPQRWTPGKDKGKPVRARFILPVSFRLQ